jgi:raffinose/stachyose/melibiose transport system substrate-binding protein
MKNKNLWLIIITILLVALLGSFSFSGCTSVEKTASNASEKSSETVSGTAPVKITMWWWGEQDSPGLEAWLKETVALFEEKNPNITVETSLLATDLVLTQFPNAVAAGEGPDIGFAWDGVYFAPWVWLGYVEPMDNWFSQEELNNMVTQKHSVFNGHTWSIGWWDDTCSMVINKTLFEKAGVEPLSLSPEWTDFMNACKQLKAAGVTPVGWGAKDMFVGEHMFSYVTSAGASSMSDFSDLADGTQSWTDKKYWQGWQCWLDLYNSGYINPDFLSLTYGQGHDLFFTGQVAIAEVPMRVARATEEKFGKGSIGIINLPKISTGKWAGQNGWYTYGNLFIPSKSEHKKEAVEFLKFMHSTERETALWSKYRIVPSNPNFDYVGQFTDPFDIELYQTMIKPVIADANSFGFWASLLMPPAPMNDIGYGVFSKLFTGEMTPEQLGQTAQDSLAKWEKSDPEFYNNYVDWMHQMKTNYAGK